MSGLILVDSSRLVALIVFLDVARNGFSQFTANGIGLIAAYFRGLVGFVVFRDIARNAFGQIAAYRVGLMAAYRIGLITRHVGGLVAANCGGLVAAYGSHQIFADRIGHILGRRIRDILRLIVDVSVFGRQVDIRCGLFHRCFCRAVCDGMRRFCGRVDFAVGISLSVQHFL